MVQSLVYMRARTTPSANRPALFLNLLLSLSLAMSVTGQAGAKIPEGSMLHEFIPPDPSEDVSFATTTLDGDLPAAIQTPSGIATAPDPQKPPSTEHVYGGTTTDDSPDSTYEPDRDTRRPNIEHYDDPFSPSTVPFKRLRAYDTVDERYVLHVHDTQLVGMPVMLGSSVGAGDEPFYGDISVDLIPNQPVRIPTVGPGARILRMHTNPETSVKLLHDSADNWFARGTTRARVRLVVQLAIARATFGSAFSPGADWNSLAKHLNFQHFEKHEEAFQRVAQAIGISRAMRPADVVEKMVEYFRSFEPSDNPPSGTGDIYLDLALSKKGVCRHRAFAFLVTALYIGLPARMVVNEAHAWVEAFDGDLWHRIDLGGAALNLESENDPTRPRYVPPPDPFEWPPNSDSGQGLADQAQAQSQQQSNQSSDPNNPAQSPTGTPNAPNTSPTAPPSIFTPTPSPTAPQSPGESTRVRVSPIEAEARRGFPFHLGGDIQSDSAPCPHVRVDVFLAGENPSSPVTALVGSLSTDEKGHFEGAVVIPRDFTLGEYRLVVKTPGDARCPPGVSR